MDILLKRVCELSPKDVFKYMQSNYIVTKVTKDKIFYKLFYENRSSGGVLVFGAKNQMKVEVINRKTLEDYYIR